MRENQYNVLRASCLVYIVFSQNSHVEHKHHYDSLCIDEKRSDNFMSGRFFVSAVKEGIL